MKLLLLLAAIIGCALSQSTCGTPAVTPNTDPSCDETKIVGGCEAVPYSWPWQVGFYQKFLGSLSLICGGSVIDNQWIMTAGHCVYGSVDKPEKFGVRMGIFDYHSEQEDGEITAEIEKIYLHPQYNSFKTDWDISLLKLKQPFNFTDHISPVCLPSSDDGVFAPDDYAWVTGWGTLHEGDQNLPKNLHQVTVPFLDQSTCDDEYGANHIDDACMFCAGRTGEDSCQGDSGGPLVKQATDGRWFEYGIVSWGYGCAEPGEAGVYSRVSAYCDFISTTIGKDLCQTPSN